MTFYPFVLIGDNLYYLLCNFFFFFQFTLSSRKISVDKNVWICHDIFKILVIFETLLRSRKYKEEKRNYTTFDHWITFWLTASKYVLNELSTMNRYKAERHVCLHRIIGIESIGTPGQKSYTERLLMRWGVKDIR